MIDSIEPDVKPRRLRTYVPLAEAAEIFGVAPSTMREILREHPRAVDVIQPRASGVTHFAEMPVGPNGGAR